MFEKMTDLFNLDLVLHNVYVYLNVRRHTINIYKFYVFMCLLKISII
jgi:hypothetical protein